MTDADAQTEESDAPDPNGDGDQPEVPEEMLADDDALDELAEEVEAEAGASADTTDDSETDQTADPTAASDPDAAMPSGESWGDMYVGTLTTVSNAVIEEFGDEGETQIDEDLARQLHLDAHFDQFMAERGQSEMPPEQALLVGTITFAVAVIGTKTDLPSKLLSEADL